MGNVSLMVMSMAVAGKGSSFLGEGSNFMDIFINFLSMIWDAIGDTLMSVVYFIVKFMLNIVDFLQFFVGKLVGINVWMDGTDVTQLELQDLDIIFRFLYSSEVQRVFKALIIIGAVLLIIFTIIAVVQSEYKTAQGDDKAFKNGKAFVLKRALTAVTLMIFVPIMTIVGILASNAVLASLTKTLNANTTLTFGGQIFVASSYDASRYRYYAMTGSRIPVTYPKAIKVVNPSKTGSGSSYYLVDANGNLTFATGSLKNMEGELADVAYNTWEYNKKYKDFVTNWDNSYTLNNVSWKSAEGDGATYSAFVVDNAADYKGEYDFSYINTTDDYMNAPNNFYTKTYSTTGNTAYATYAPIPAEYMVVADFIDYAIEYSQKVFVVNVTNESIDWSKVPTRYYKIIENDGIREAVEIAVDYREGLYSDVSGRVIYRGNNNVNSETQGAQYIYATLENGKYVPILANKTNSGAAFTSSYLADGYEGVVIARGVFDTNGNPTEIYQVSTEGMTFTDPKYVLAQADADATVEAYVSRVDYNYKETVSNEDVYSLGISVTYEIDGEPGGTAWYGFNSATAFNSDPTVAMDILSKNSSILSYQTYYEGGILKVKVYDKSRNLTFVLPSNYFSAAPGNGTELKSLSFQNMNIGKRENIEKNEAEVLTTERYAIALDFYNINGSKLDNKTTLSYTFDNQINTVDFTNIENVTIGNTNYIRFKLSDDYSLLLNDTTDLIFESAISATLADPKKAVDYLNALFNPEYLYEFNYITTSYTALPLKEAQENDGKSTYYVYNIFASGQIKEVRYNIDFDAIPKADYVISFRRNDIKWGIGFDININGLKFSTWRFHLGVTYDINETSVAKLPVDSGMILNYNFSSSNGILMENLFKPSRINPIVLVFATVLIFKLLGTAVWGMIKRIFDIVIHFIVMPGFVSTIALDDGARFAKWKDGLIKAIFGAYGVILGLNFFFILVPILKDATQIFTASDLPSSLQGSFVGNSIFANPDVLNNIVYILFLLVAFTLIKSMPSMIAGWFGGNDYVKEGNDVRGAVQANNKAVASFVSGNDAKAAVKNAFNMVTSFFPGSAFYGDKMSKVFGKVKNRAGETLHSAAETIRNRHEEYRAGAPERAAEREARREARRAEKEKNEGLTRAEVKRNAYQEKLDRLEKLRKLSPEELSPEMQEELQELSGNEWKIKNSFAKYQEQVNKQQEREQKRFERENDKAVAEEILNKSFEDGRGKLSERLTAALDSGNNDLVKVIQEEIQSQYNEQVGLNKNLKKNKHFAEDLVNEMKSSRLTEEFEKYYATGNYKKAEQVYNDYLNANKDDKRLIKAVRNSVGDKRLQIAENRLNEAREKYRNNPNDEKSRMAFEKEQQHYNSAYWARKANRLSFTTEQRIAGKREMVKGFSKNLAAFQGKSFKAKVKTQQMISAVKQSTLEAIQKGKQAVSVPIEKLREVARHLKENKAAKELHASEFQKAVEAYANGGSVEDYNKAFEEHYGKQSFVNRVGALSKIRKAKNTHKIAERFAASKAGALTDLTVRQFRADNNRAIEANRQLAKEEGLHYFAKKGMSSEMRDALLGDSAYRNARFSTRRAMRKVKNAQEFEGVKDKNGVADWEESMKQFKVKKVQAVGKKTLESILSNNAAVKKIDEAIEKRASYAKKTTSLQNKKGDVERQRKDLRDKVKQRDEVGAILKDLAKNKESMEALGKGRKKGAEKSRLERQEKELTRKLQSYASKHGLKFTGSDITRIAKELDKKLGTDEKLKKTLDTFDKKAKYLEKMLEKAKSDNAKLAQNLKEQLQKEDKKRWSAVKEKEATKNATETSSTGKSATGNAAQRRDTGGAGNAGMK